CTLAPAFLFTEPPPPDSSTLSLHDALPISGGRRLVQGRDLGPEADGTGLPRIDAPADHELASSPEALVVGQVRRGGIDQGDHQRSEEHTSELQSRENLVCRLLLEKKKKDND